MADGPDGAAGISAGWQLTDAGKQDDGLTPAAPGRLTEQESRRLSALVADAVAPATRRAYRADWNRWQTWCDRRDVAAMPADPSLVALYLEEHANAQDAGGEYVFSPATLSRWVAALNQICRAAGQRAPGEDPGVKAALSAIRRTRKRPPQRREPLLLDDLSRITDQIRASAGRLRAIRIIARRDLAVVTAGFFGGFRRSELSQLRLSDVAYQPDDGLHVRLRHSKTDQEGDGQVTALPFTDDPGVCPVCAVLQWMSVVQAWDQRGRAGIIRVLRSPDHDPADGHLCGPDHPALVDRQVGQATGEVLLLRAVHRSGNLRDGGLSGHSINTLIQRRADEAGVAAKRVANMGGHSLRAGLVTEAYRAGASAEEIARQTGHQSLSVLAGYRREHAPLAGNAVSRLTGRTETGPKESSITGSTGAGAADDIGGGAGPDNVGTAGC